MDEKNSRYLLPALILIFGTALSLYTVERHQRLMTTTFDLGIFDQAVYLTQQGESLFLNTRGLHVQGDHFHPILYLIAPLYLFTSSSEVLLILQSFVVALGLYPVYHLSRRHRISVSASILIGMSYLVHPTVAHLYAFDFHPVAIMMTAFLFAAYFLETGSPVGYGISLTAAVSCTESAGFTVLALALTAFAIRNWRWAASTFLVGISSMILSKFWLRYFNEGQTTPYAALYTEYGSSELDILRYLFFNPIDSLERLGNGSYFYFLLVPLVLLPLLSPERLLPIAPTVLGNLLSWRESQQSAFFHYGAAVAPFLIWATIVGWSRLRGQKVSELWLGLCLVLGLCVSLANGPWQTQLGRYRQGEGDIERVIEAVQETDSVVSDAALGGHLSQRRELYLFPNPFISIAWGNNAEALIEQASKEHTPISRGEVRRGVESQLIDVVVLAKRQWQHTFPFDEADSDWCRRQILRSPYYQIEVEDDSSLLLRRRGL